MTSLPPMNISVWTLKVSDNLDSVQDGNGTLGGKRKEIGAISTNEFFVFIALSQSLTMLHRLPLNSPCILGWSQTGTAFVSAS